MAEWKVVMWCGRVEGGDVVWPSGVAWWEVVMWSG